jgi:nucleotide-binding universal stress UspA family protein
VKHARKIGADLVVMTTHGRGGLRRAWLGSVTEKLVRTLHIPLLVVRPREDGSLPSTDLRNVLVPVDGSPLAETAVEPAAALAHLWDAEMSLLQIVYPVVLAADPVLSFMGGYDDELTGIRRETADDYLRDVTDGLRARGVKASGVAIVGIASVADTLLQLSEPQHVSLVVMATHGRGGFRRLMIGSVTDKLIRGAQVPVLVVPPVRALRHSRPETVRASAAALVPSLA